MKDNECEIIINKDKIRCPKCKLELNIEFLEKNCPRCNFGIRLPSCETCTKCVNKLDT